MLIDVSEGGCADFWGRLGVMSMGGGVWAEEGGVRLDARREHYELMRSRGKKESRG